MLLSHGRMLLIGLCAEACKPYQPLREGADLGITWCCLYGMPFGAWCAAVWVGNFSCVDLHLQAVVFVGDLSYADDFVSSPHTSLQVLEALSCMCCMPLA